jgi:hypothetical protein
MVKYIACAHAHTLISSVARVYSTLSTEVDYFRLLLEFTVMVFALYSVYKIKIQLTVVMVFMTAGILESQKLSKYIPQNYVKNLPDWTVT